MTDPRLATAQSLLAAGNAAAAKSLLDSMLGSSRLAGDDRRVALLLRARAYEDRRELAEAIADTRAALTLHPADPRTHNALGILCADAGDAAGALAAFARATELDPGYARAWNNLGNALRDGGRTSEAMGAFSRAVTAQPDYALGWSNLGAVQRDLGDDHAAESSLRRAIALKADHRAAMLTLAGLLRARGDIDEAAALYARASQLAPRDTGPLFQLAGTLAERDDLDAARRAYADVRARKPDALRAAIGAELMLPMVYADAAAVSTARIRYAEGLARLEAQLPPLARRRTPADVIDDLRWSNFLLAYQGGDDRELQARYAAVVARTIDTIAAQSRAPIARSYAGGRRIRIGFASAFFSEGTVGMYFRRWIERLDRSRFEVTLYNLRRGVNPFLTVLSAKADRVRSFDGPALAPSVLAPTIRDDALDVLVYPELGMDATSFVLAALRLAPVQCAAWGHPVTTGHPTIDVYFTCGPMEPPDADAHYTERLVRLPGIGTEYSRPALPEDATRARFGLPDATPLWLCPQSLFKIHPDNDALFARALAAAPDARLVMFQGRHPALTAKFLARLRAACERENIVLAERAIVVPQCSHPDYLRINLVCDVMLDTLHWSGGNTSLDALACSLPIVTLPGRLMRGRQSAAMLELAGVGELVARDDDDYIRIAARLTTDRSYRQSMSERIRAGHSKIFDDRTPIDALAHALVSVAHNGVEGLAPN